MLSHLFQAYVSSRSGATAIEYALIAGGIALAVIVGVGLIGGAVDSTLTEVGSGL